MAKDYKFYKKTIPLTQQEYRLFKAIQCLEERQHKRRLGLKILHNSYIDNAIPDDDLEKAVHKCIEKRSHGET